MYKFEVPGAVSTVTSGITTTFNGTLLDDNNFKTLVVNGRDIVSEHHDVADVPGMDGIFYKGSKLKERVIKIRALIKSDNLRGYFERLNKVLHTDGVKELSFSDEADRCYLAKFESIESIDERSNTLIVDFNFVCYSPFKYGPVNISTGSGVTVKTDYPILPKISIRLDASVSEVRLLHVESQKYIRLVGTYLSGNTIVIDFEKRTIYLNGRNDLHKFDMVNSRFFSLVNGVNTLNLNVGGAISTEWRGKFL